jgi:exopolysaccharide biosynthesis polyprenyl glycosylphosphotransferase
MADVSHPIGLPADVIVAHAPGRAIEERSAGIGSALAAWRRVSLRMALTDVAAFVAAMLVAYLIRFRTLSVALDFALVMALAPVVAVAVFSAFRLYGVQHLSSAEEFRRLMGAIAFTMTGIVTVSFWSKESYSRVWVGLTWILAIVFVLAARRMWHGIIRKMRADGRLAYRTLMVGTNGELARLTEALDEPSQGFRMIGSVATNADGERFLDIELPVADAELPILGHVSELRDVIRSSAAECVFVASSSVTPKEMAEVVRAARQEGVEVRMSANLPEMVSTRLLVKPYGGLMAMTLKPVRLTGRQAVVKRAFDVVVAGLGLLLISPLWLAIAAAIKLTSRGPVLYRQERVGRGGQAFTMLKFRTMVRGAEAMRSQLVDQNEATGPLFKIRQDPRTTAPGRFLRRWSLDELPQLVNVVRGEMSLVGPRPPLPEEVRHYDEWHTWRFEVPPGITGMWQVSGRSDASFDDYVRLDLFYIENWALSFDLFILAKTLPAIASRKGAY